MGSLPVIGASPILPHYRKGVSIYWFSSKEDLSRARDKANNPQDAVPGNYLVTGQWAFMP